MEKFSYKLPYRSRMIICGVLSGDWKYLGGGLPPKLGILNPKNTGFSNRIINSNGEQRIVKLVGTEKITIVSDFSEVILGSNTCARLSTLSLINLQKLGSKSQ